MSKFQTLDRWRRPEAYFSDLINKSIRGDFQDSHANAKIWYRALVVAVDVRGAKLENEDGTGVIEHVVNGKKVQIPALTGPDNPRNSVKARIFSDEFDQYISDDDLRVFWPMMPEHDSIPIKPGEHVYVTFEDEGFEHGLWLGKVAGQENVNFYRGEKAFVTDDKNVMQHFDSSKKEDDNVDNTDKAASGRFDTTNIMKLFGE